MKSYELLKMKDLPPLAAHEEIANAKIMSTQLGECGRGFTGFVGLDGHGWGVSFGGIGLQEHFCWAFVDAIIRVVGVERWEQLPGNHVRAVKCLPGDRLEVIGHLVKDQWFVMDDFCEKMKAAR